MYLADKICDIIDGHFLQRKENGLIEHLLFDSRKINFPSTSIYFALIGPRRNGHSFIAELYNKGVKNFVVSETIEISLYPAANFIKVKNTLDALQVLAIFHRSQFNIPVIGITGSNGKTIVKEWLYQLLHEQYTIIRSPKSFNSQIGVIGHELGHISDYNKRPGIYFIKLLFMHLNKSKMDRFEYNTDMRCIEHGLGYQLLSWSTEVRLKLNLIQWKGIKHIEGKGRERYMNPESIMKEISQNNLYN